LLLQEHWLLPFELDTLNNIHPDFYSSGSSAVDTSASILMGRPYGGTACLYRKELAYGIKPIHSTNSRISGLSLETDCGCVLLLNVYMPTNYGDSASLELYVECLAYLHALIVDSVTVHTVIAGDFNCSIGSRFFGEFTDFVHDNNLVMSDLRRLSNVCTYVSDDGSKTSWVDHIVSSPAADQMLLDMSVMDNFITSDHRPLKFSMQCKPSIPSGPGSALKSSSECKRYLWNDCSDDVLRYYANYLDGLLQHIIAPTYLLSDLCSDCDTNVVDKFYCDITACVREAVDVCIPSRVYETPDNSFNVPGWNSCVKEKHETARIAYLDWCISGKPKQGLAFELMKRTRATFKLAVRYCKNHVDQMRADACANSLMNKDAEKFWKDVYKFSNKTTSNQVVGVGEAVGAENVCNLWKDHFANLYGSKVNSVYRSKFFAKLRHSNLNMSNLCIDVCNMTDVVNKQKRNKAAGPDGIFTESYVYGGRRLCVYLCMAFNIFLKFGYLPGSMCLSAIMPLIKNKTGDVTDVNNYRAIAVSNAVTKILEGVLFGFIETDDKVDVYQFGFRKQLSTGLCTNVFKSTVNYYREHGSHIFCCFIDFTKAFDSVDYWLLFCKMLDCSKNTLYTATVRLLSYWYSHQMMFVRWQGVESNYFCIANGVRQGGILSPYLFRIYVRDLIAAVVSSSAGCCDRVGLKVNLLAYADDMVLLAPSWHALQLLLSVIEKGAQQIDLSFNTSKTVCMVFSPCDRRKSVSESFPQFVLNGAMLSFVPQFKYLGHIVDNSCYDDGDINREVRCLFARTNILLRRFRRCSVKVKLQLFKSYCICFYNIALWKVYHVSALDKVASAYVRCVKLFFGYDKYSSCTAMFLQLGLPTFDTILHNARVQFESKLSVLSCNVLVSNSRNLDFLY